MKRKTRIIQISGIRGLLMAIFIGICLVAGFIVFPGYVAMRVWNYFAVFEFMGNTIPQIALYQGILLWGIIAGLGYVANDKKKYLVSMKNSHELTDEELKKILDNIKVQTQAQTVNSMVIKSNEIKSSCKESESQNIEGKKEKEEVNQ